MRTLILSISFLVTMFPVAGQGKESKPNADIHHFSPIEAEHESVSGQIFIADSNILRASATFNQDHNYILTKKPTSSVPNVYQINESNSVYDIVYYDGLGRPEQQVSIGASFNGNDIISPIVYDIAGRDDSKSYLPYVAGSGANGSFRTNAVNAQQAFYTSIFGASEGVWAYTEQVYEKSGVNRVTENYGVGAVYRVGDGIKSTIGYEANHQNEVVLYATSGSGISATLLRNGYYPAGTIAKTIITNEDGCSQVEYSDLLGRIILKRTIGSNNSAQPISYDTYYIYDDYGNLNYVLPPELSAKIIDGAVTNLSDSSIEIKQYAYVYKYDSRGRVIEKRIPGKDWEYMVYDRADRLVLSQDGNMRIDNAGMPKAKPEWMYQVYDDHNRIANQNIVASSLGRAAIQAKYDAAGFNNSYAALASLGQLQKPFGDNSFEFVSMLLENRYGGYNYSEASLVDTSSKLALNIHDLSDWKQLRDTSSIIEAVGEEMFAKELDIADIPVEFHPYYSLPLNYSEPLPDDSITDDVYVEFHTYYPERLNHLNPDLEEFISTSGEIDHSGYYMGHGTIPGLVLYDLPIYSKCLIIADLVREQNLAHVYRLATYPGGEIPMGLRARWPEYNEPQEPDPNPTPSNLSFAPVAGVVMASDLAACNTGLLVSRKRRVLNAPNNIIESAYYYDAKARLLQSVEKNHLGGINRISFKYDFVGNILTCHECIQPSATAAIDLKVTACVYDTHSRLLSETMTLNNTAPVTVIYGYDELGKLCSKTTDGILETMDYNIQGWMTSKSARDCRANELFCMDLNYYTPSHSDSEPSYTGNISEWDWRYGSDGDKNTYAFTYDNLSRLVGTEQYLNDTPSDRFRELGMLYDQNGNLTALMRRANDDIQAYTYKHNGNQLTSITTQQVFPDSPGYKPTPIETTGFSCDPNGNLVYDAEHNLNISYNAMNLIQKVEQSGTTLANYTYLSDGTKLSVTDASGNGLCYQGSLVYTKQGGNLTLESSDFSGGRILATNNGYDTRYFITDHLGSTRVVVNNAGDVLERNDYYPYGTRWEDENSAISENRYLFNGKEDQSFINIPYLDYGARMYNGTRWINMDPLAERYPSISPYAYCANNPVRFVDPNGAEVWIYFQGEDGNKQKMLYTTNMKYEGSNAFISTSVNYLNNIYSYGGATALDLLIESSNKFAVTSEMSSVEGTLAFKENQNGGGSFKLGAIMTPGFEKSQGIESMAHELFHGVQHEEKQSGVSVLNEVEAYVFGATVMNNWMNAPNSDFLGGPHSLAGNGQANASGANYENAFKSLTSQFSINTFDHAVNNFKEGAYKNATGLYNNYPIRRANQTKYLLPQYYPR